MDATRATWERGAAERVRAAASSCRRRPVATAVGHQPPSRGRPLPRCLASRVALWVGAAIVAATSLPTNVGAQGGLDAVFKASAERVLKVGVAARTALEPDDPCSLRERLATCGCTSSPCGNTFGGNLTCSTTLGPNLKACEGSSCSSAMLDFDNSYVRIGRGLLAKDGSTNLAAARDVCLTKVLNSHFRALGQGEQFTYFATANGVFRLHPGRPVGSEALNTCTQWEPRLRPWYSAASSGPKDVVIIVDTSSDMRLPMVPGSRTTRWASAVSAAVDVLDTLNPRDFVAVFRTAGGGAAPAAAVSGTGARLVEATEDRRNVLKKELRLLRPEGPLDMAGATREAFASLIRSARGGGAGGAKTTAGCSRVVLWITGGRDACYKRPECRTRTAPDDCACTQTVLDEVGKQQAALVAVSGAAEAIVATLTIGDRVDESLARQMACVGSGVWSRVTSSELSFSSADVEQARATDLNGYYKLLSASRWKSRRSVDQVVYSRVYEGEEGLGLMTTATFPVFSQWSKRVLGVVGTDIPIEQLKEKVPGTTDADIKAAVANWAPTCQAGGNQSALIQPCELQRLRGPESACPPIRPSQSFDCFTFVRDPQDDDRGFFYAPIHRSQWRSWENAFYNCRSFGGQLAVAPSEQVNQKLAALADVDGSWIGVRRGRDATALGEWVMPNERPVSTFFWSAAQRSDDCVAVDRRGLRSNWFTRPCDELRPFICNINVFTNTSAKFCRAVVSLSDQDGKDPNPRTKGTICERSNQGRPPSGAGSTCGGSALINTKPLCPMAAGDRTAALCTQTCCGDCSCQSLGADAEPRIGIGAIAGIIVGGLIVLVIVCVAYATWKRWQDVRRRAANVDDDSDGEEYYEMRQSEEASAISGSVRGDRREDQHMSPLDMASAARPSGSLSNRIRSWTPGSAFSGRTG